MLAWCWDAFLRSARVSRVGDCVLLSQTFSEGFQLSAVDELPGKIVSARRRNQHGRRVRYPDSLTQQVRAILFRAFDRLLFSPLGDFGVISAKQNVRDLPTAKLGGPRVLRSF